MPSHYVALISQHSLDGGGVDDIYGWGESPEAAIESANGFSNSSSPYVEKEDGEWRVHSDQIGSLERLVFDTRKEAEAEAERHKWRTGPCTRRLYDMLAAGEMASAVGFVWVDGRYDVDLGGNELAA